MDFRKLTCIAIILTATFIAIVIGSPKTSTEFNKIICIQQLKEHGHFTGNETSTDSFLHVFDNLVTPLKRLNTYTKGHLYSYIDHLHEAAVVLYSHVKIDDPLEWCISNIQRYFILHENDIDTECNKDLSRACFTGTAQEAIKLTFYRYRTYEQLRVVALEYILYVKEILTPWIKYTTAKSVNNFCEDIENYKVPVIFDPNLQYHQLPAQGNVNVVERNIQYQQPPTQQNENVLFDPNLGYHQLPAYPNENFVFDPSRPYQQPSAQRNNMFGLNQQYHQPPAYPNEHFVFDSSQQHQQPPAQRNLNVLFDPNLGYHQAPAYLNEHFVLDPSRQYQQLFAQINENVFNQNVQYHQPPAQRNDHHTTDFNLQLFGLPTPPVNSVEYPRNQPETSTSYKYDDKNLDFDLNELPQGE